MNSPYPDISSLEYDSRKVSEGSLFFALPGAQTDGNLFVNEALRQGAVAVASERAAPRDFPAWWLQVAEARKYMAILADHYYEHPSEQLSLIGITGTNGKTTTSYLVHSILSLASPSILLGTVKSVVGDRVWESERTTPEATDIQRWLAEGIAAGCRSGVLEVSSHALEFNRVYGCQFRVAVFTNLSQDHLDFHGTMSEYLAAKKRLFDLSYNPGLREAVTNGDDPYVRQLEVPSGVRLTTFGFSKENEVFPLEHETSIEGSRLSLHLAGHPLELESPLVGEHNLYNLMAAATACFRLGVPDTQIQLGVRRLSSVPGRFERVPLEAGFSVFVDYAHTPHALENVLRLARAVCSGRIICVVGCGGDRDRNKRPQMGRIAAELSDQVVLTSDNPRSEEPLGIIREMEVGIPVGKKGHWMEVDRRSAIARALRTARRGDLVLVAGKGHETYQEIAGRKIPFDDREVVREVYAEVR